MGLPPPPPEGTTMLPKGTFDGKVVAITGGGTGLGKAFGLEFARLGATVAILSRSEAHRLNGVRAIEAIGGKAIQVPLDVRDAGAVQAAFDSVEGMAGPVDIFLNNAAGNFPVPAEDLSANGFRAVVQIDLEGTFNCSREMARRAISELRPGVILNIGSPTYHGGGPGFAHVAAAKAGVHNLTYSLAVEWAPYGIRVNTLVPGFFPHEDPPKAVYTANVGDSGGGNTPAQRLGKPYELAWAATFLCSPFASMVTGSIFVVDGGMSLAPGPRPYLFTPIREQLGRGPFIKDRQSN
jgi:NAD(P)-dependent dehydrogenase (short-subunit alcohol dehydrogenase family)